MAVEKMGVQLLLEEDMSSSAIVGVQHDVKTYGMLGFARRTGQRLNTGH
jgi:hypothetical protein